MTIAFEMKGITKAFPGVRANDHIDFSVNTSEIRGLLGENGAGKTVLMKILYGLYTSDEGDIFVNERLTEINNPAMAIQQGIGMVHQHFMLVPSLTVLENIILGNESTTKLRVLDEKKMLQEVSTFCKRYNLDVDLKAPIYSLSVGVQQRVEILKALYRGADILILDEPTAILTPHEVEELFKAIRQLKTEGKTVIFISHKLKEVLTICDTITVLRKGKVVQTVKANETNQTELANMMVGRRIITDFKKTLQPSSPVILKIEHIQAINDRKLPVLNGINLEISSSEILGIAGVEGNGQTELIEVIMGLRKASSGTILLENTEITNMSTRERRSLGISHIPEDRHKRGLIPDFSVMENLILGSHNDPQFTKWGFSFNHVETSNYSQKLIKDYNIETPSKDAPARYLSGGTQQRVIVAREFSRKPTLIIAAQPTRGLDVAGTEYVHLKLVGMRNQGVAILLISADLDEIWALSDHIAVLYEGKIVAIKKPKDTTQQELGLLMTGGSS
jgi:simple sugar transport system ATP-binding protein